MKPLAWLAAAITFVMMLPVLLAAVVVTAVIPAATSAAVCGSPTSTGSWRVPLTGAYRITSGFGMRFHPILRRTKLHTGIDLAATGDRTVVAAAAGTVNLAGFNTAYGNQVVIDHGKGIATRYGHLADRPAVHAGQKVMAGDRLGIEGQTGYATGIHLHFEVIEQGQTIDPQLFMAEVGAPLNGTAAKANADIPSTPASGEVTATRGDGQPVTLKGEQLTHASVIITVGRDLAVPHRGIVVALMAALQESGVRNLDYGDRDSLGLFQQRASWGTATERQTPTYAARAFYGGPAGPNLGSPRGLLDIDDWQSFGPGQAAQAVQVSAFPRLYDRWEPVARALLDHLSAGSGGGCTLVAAGSVRVATWNVCLEFCPDLKPWHQRVPAIAAQLLATGADVIALQETGRKHPQGDTLAAALSSRYRVAAYHRSKMILIKPERIAPTDADGHPLPGRELMISGRGGVAQVLRSKVTGTEFVLTDLHPQNGSTRAADQLRDGYVRQAHAIAEVLSDRGRRPIVHAGDLNSHLPGTRTHHMVAEFFTAHGYRSAESFADHRDGARFASYNGGHPPMRGRRIDHVVVTRATPVASWRQILAPDPQHPPTDHHLIVVDLQPTIDAEKKDSP